MVGDVTSNKDSVYPSTAAIYKKVSAGSVSSIWTLDFLVLSVLFLATLLCLVPVSIGGASLPDILRVMATFYLFFRLFLRVLSGLNLAPVLPLFAYLLVTVLILGISLINYGVHVSLVCYGQFILVSLMAPLFCYFVTNRRQAYVLIMIWIAVCLFGFFTLLLQKYNVNSFDWFSNYQASRSGLARYETVLGNPNPTGVCGALLALLGLFFFRKLRLRALFFLAGLGLLVFSLSRGALLTFAAGFIAYLLLSAASYRARRRVFLGVACFVVLLFAASFLPGFNGVTRYFAAYEGIVSGADTAQLSISVRVESPVKFIQNHVLSNPVAWVVGSGYGVSGSASEQLREKGNARANGILPNSGLLELFLDGGVVLLGSFLFLFGWVWFRLFRLARLTRDNYYYVTLSLLSGIFIYTIVFPTFYQPNIGGLFWLLISLGLVDRYIRP